jgi:hypothetical protein
MPPGEALHELGIDRIAAEAEHDRLVAFTSRMANRTLSREAAYGERPSFLLPDARKARRPHGGELDVRGDRRTRKQGRNFFRLHQVPYHLIDIVLKGCHLTGRLHCDRSREIPFTHSIRDLGDRAHLGRQVGAEVKSPPVSTDALRYHAAYRAGP